MKKTFRPSKVTPLGRYSCALDIALDLIPASFSLIKSKKALSSSFLSLILSMYAMSSVQSFERPERSSLREKAATRHSLASESRTWNCLNILARGVAKTLLNLSSYESLLESIKSMRAKISSVLSQLIKTPH